MSARRAVIYARISQDRSGESLGVQRQESECRELCDRSGWDVVNVLVDNDISAYSGKKRPAYQRLLAMIRGGSVDVVVAWNTDRLHRRLAELVEYVEACNQRTPVTTHTVRTGLIDLATPSGILVAQQLGAVSEYESRNRSARMRARGDQRAEEGRYSGGPRPFGWEPDGESPREDEQRFLRDAIRDALSGVSLQEIARRWRTQGVPTVSGGSWTARRIRETILRPRVAGLLQHRGQIVGLARWDPVVSPEEWHSLRQMLTDPGRVTTKRSGVAPRHLGTNRYRCGALLPDGTPCDFPMRVTRSGDSRRSVYGCTRRPKLGITHVTVPRDLVDDYVRDKLVHAMVEQGVGPPAAEDPGDVSPTDRLTTVQEAMDALAMELAAERMSPTAFSTANAQLAKRRDALLEQQAQQVQSRSAQRQLEGFDTDPFGTWDALPLDVRRDWLDYLVTVTVLPTGRGNYRYGKSVADRVRLEWNRLSPE